MKILKKTRFFSTLALLINTYGLSQHLNFDYNFQYYGNSAGLTYSKEIKKSTLSGGIRYYTKGYLRFNDYNNTRVAPKNTKEHLVLEIGYRYNLNLLNSTIKPFIGLSTQYASAKYLNTFYGLDAEGNFDKRSLYSYDQHIINFLPSLGFSFPITEKLSYFQSFNFGIGMEIPKPGLLPKELVWDHRRWDWVYGIRFGLSYDFSATEK